ncbi:MAG TPA: bifunctional oligoribonuclease/PAP phosphatase NrnA [Anaerolineales bacterium]|nr:bifunctional oligoribonuclease/PAP phosphatase NrnA [Anaerolineales bacterium]
MQNFDLDSLRQVLENPTPVGIVTHVSPDGDAFGSMLAMTLALRARGRTVLPICADELTPNFGYLPLYSDIQRYAPPHIQNFIVVDAADIRRIGEANNHIQGKPDLNIDHHVSNTRFANLNLVNAEASATAEYLYDLFVALGWEVTSEMAECLLTGIVTDTLGFRTPSTTPHTLQVVQKLTETGASLQAMIDLSMNRRSFQAIRLWGQVLSKAHMEDGLVWSTVTDTDRSKSGYSALGDADVINVMSTVRDADVVVLFVEKPNREVKISWRSLTGLDVSSLAQEFGGGGHVAAAGANLYGVTLRHTQDKVLNRTRQALREFLRNAR